jgi:hypothetical protein
MGALSLTQIASSSAPQGISLWIPPASGAIAAVLVAVIGAVLAFNASVDKAKGFREWLKSTVDAGPAWSVSDSWLTNISGVGGILGAAVSSSGSLVTPDTATALTLLFLIFSGTAAFAPLTYVALATQPSSDTSIVSTNTSAWGFLSAAIVTMTAAMGELATLSLLVCQISSSATGKILLVAFLVIAAFLIAIYAVKTIKMFAASQPATTKADAAHADAAHADAAQLGAAQLGAAQLGAAQPRILPAQSVLPTIIGNARSATL